LLCQQICNEPCSAGTGKTVSLLSLITAYQYKHQDVGKLVYCTRTVQEVRLTNRNTLALMLFERLQMDKVVDELRRVMKYREQILGTNATDKKADEKGASTRVGQRSIAVCRA
jgi:Rad3-related DNA helicase